MRQSLAVEVAGGYWSGACRASTVLSANKYGTQFVANESTGAMQKLSTLIAEIEAEAYARGQSDARKALLDILGAGGKRATPTGGKARKAGGGGEAPGRREQARAEGLGAPLCRAGFARQSGFDRAGNIGPGVHRRGTADQAVLDPGRIGERTETGQVCIAWQALVARGLRFDGSGRGRLIGRTPGGGAGAGRCDGRVDRRTGNAGSRIPGGCDGCVSRRP